MLAALLLAAAAGCAEGEPASGPSSAATTPPPVATSATAPPVPSAPPEPGATTEPAATVSNAFPLTVTRRGGFAGLDESASIAADGSATLTREGRAPEPVRVPAATTAELRRLLSTPDLAARAAPSPGAPVCADGYEYRFVTPSATTVVPDCGGGHGAALDRLLSISAGLFAR
ncbi:hypothetical protein [Actinoplanes teichomyceticus]|uniref:hypothetical protein n=1 Tax=Actinoplanes teichomyceticus TaxID=1867 RepID=UPI0013DE20E5|nr:hypothetical protein [Actinoplanes teichomyceticus]